MSGVSAMPTTWTSRGSTSQTVKAYATTKPKTKNTATAMKGSLRLCGGLGREFVGASGYFDLPKSNVRTLIASAFVPSFAHPSASIG
jgi:hypothetical protein